MLLADELEDSEDNCNSNRMVEEPENQIFFHQILPNLLKKKENCLSENSVKLVSDFCYYILLQTIVERLESNGIFRAPDLSVIVEGSTAAKMMGFKKKNSKSCRSRRQLLSEEEREAIKLYAKPVMCRKNKKDKVTPNLSPIVEGSTTAKMMGVAEGLKKLFFQKMASLPYAGFIHYFKILQETLIYEEEQ
ncbi:U4/U6 small nuclear ribonucleoprotein Prp31-like [Vespula squamosa]|uniref:U4/U6 small nuclear ribonucleoprotein Prp31-like n=1 Tax=Vespula squamosa TaxID=30214 RepID=A0ABD2BWX8_VESSQ